MPQSNLELGVFVGASETKTGTNGLVPRPTAGQQNRVLGASGEWVPGLFNPATGQLMFDGGTVTASTPVLDLSQTWNNGAVTFTADKLNVTDSASAATSLVFDRQVGGVSQLSVRKDGLVRVNLALSLANNASTLALGSASDVVLTRDAAQTLALRNSTNAQTWNVYGTTDAGLLNYRRIRTTMTTGGDATIAAEGYGTGVSGNSLSFSTDGTSIASMDANGMQLNAGHLQMVEVAAPSAPGSNKGRIYLEDNGSGKTRLMIRFNSGAAQQIAIEP